MVPREAAPFTDRSFAATPHATGLYHCGVVLELTTPQIFVFITLIVALGRLVTERLRIDVIACLITLALALTPVLTPEQAFAGFGSEPAIVIASIFIKTAAMNQTGLAEIMG